jgi:hypothetical protein
MGLEGLTSSAIMQSLPLLFLPLSLRLTLKLKNMVLLSFPFSVLQPLLFITLSS